MTINARAILTAIDTRNNAYAFVCGLRDGGLSEDAVVDELLDWLEAYSYDVERRLDDILTFDREIEEYR